MTVTGAPALRCSAWTRGQDVDPVGTAGYYRGFVLADVPLPWPRDVGQMDQLEPVGRLVDGRRYRIQAVVPDPGGDGGRVVLHAPAGDGGAGWFSGYRRTEAAARPDLASALEQLLAQADAPDADPGPAVTDLLVCTHGRRDVCCGSMGTELYGNLAGTGRLPAGVRLRRTSHTGGHRFAPTFLLLPQGTMWAYADSELVYRVLERSVPFDRVAGHYRGCSGLGPAPVQALERAVLAETGWDLLDRPRRGFATGEASADGGGRYRLETVDGAWEATARPGRTLPVPDCLKPISEASKTETEWVVSDLQAV